MREFLRKYLFFKSQTVAATGYYGIEDPLPDIISNFAVYGELREPIVGCQEPLVVKMP